MRNDLNKLLHIDKDDMILIEHIDEIARRLQRDVLFLEFHPKDQQAMRIYRYQEDQRRAEIIAWLDQHAIAWQMCGPLMIENRVESYKGTIFIDAEINEENLIYQQLIDYLENPDGTCRYEGLRFYALDLNTARTNIVDQGKIIDHLFSKNND